MSFLKKLTKEFDGLKTNFLKDDNKKGEKKEEKKEDHGQAYGSQPQYPSQPGQSAYNQQPQYSQQPQPLTPQPGPPGSKPLPSGWIQQWDQSSQRWYYIEQATGRTQWEPPVPAPTTSSYPQTGYGPPGSEANRGNNTGYGSANPYGQPASGGPLPVGPGVQQSPAIKEEKKKGHGGLVAGAAGGLAVGAVGGALIAHAAGDDSSSDDEHHHRSVVQPSYAHTEPQYYTTSQPTTMYTNQPAPIPAALPERTASGGSVSSSDRESVQKAREEYENASASDKEEAREEYEEEYEETYGD